MKVPFISFFSVIFFILVATSFLFGQQPINVTLTASPPYSIYYDSYLEDFNNATVTLSNTDKKKSFEMSAVMTIFGPGGIQILSRDAGCTLGMNPEIGRAHV